MPAAKTTTAAKQAPPHARPRHAQRLADLDRRHDELIDQLDELNTRIEHALQELLPAGATSSSAPVGPTC